MAMLQMQRIYLCALKKDRKSLLELLQRRGVVEISDKIPEDKILKKTDVSVAEDIFEKNINNAMEALKILTPYITDDSPMLEGMLGIKEEITLQVYDEFADRYTEVVKTAKRVIELSRSIAETRAEISKLEVQLKMLQPWISLDVPINFKGTKQTKSFIGTLPYEWTLEEVYQALADFMPVHVDIISASKEQTCIFVLCENEKSDEISATLRRNGFAYPGLSFYDSPKNQLDILRGMIELEEDKLVDAEEEIKASAKYKNDLLFLQDYDQLRKDKYSVLGRLLQTKNVFMLTGYIAKDQVESLTKELEEKYTIVVDVLEPTEEEDVPVIFDNSKFSAPLESTVTGFSAPGKGEADPTTVMSLFFYMFFGLMLSDAGYGALIAIACGFCLVKFKGRLEIAMEKTLRMYLYCGIATIFWGVMFGSYFGDIVDTVGKVFFNVDIWIPPVWFFPVDDPMKMLSFALGVGIIHIFAGLGLSMYQMYLKKDYKGMIYDVLFWYIMLGSVVVILLSMDMITSILGISFVLPKVVVSIAQKAAILSALGIVFTNGRESKNPVLRVVLGAYELYGASGYLGDILSYSRILALGLATGVICTVINQMGAMVGGGIVGAIAFTIIMLVGHGLNFAINALGAYVHTTRLQYVEFFGKFYEGGGEEFKPFEMNTKYYKFKEKRNNG